MAYVEEFRLLQILVQGLSEESLLGTLIEGLKSWIARELKLKQSQQLTHITHIMRMTEILEESPFGERWFSKDNFRKKNSLTPKGSVSWQTDPRMMARK